MIRIKDSSQSLSIETGQLRRWLGSGNGDKDKDFSMYLRDKIGNNLNWILGIRVV